MWRLIAVGQTGGHISAFQSIHHEPVSPNLTFKGGLLSQFEPHSSVWICDYPRIPLVSVFTCAIPFPSSPDCPPASARIFWRPVASTSYARYIMAGNESVRRDTNDNRVSLVLGVAIFLMATSTLMVVLRVMSRATVKQFRLDDMAAIASLVG